MVAATPGSRNPAGWSLRVSRAPCRTAMSADAIAFPIAGKRRSSAGFRDRNAHPQVRAQELKLAFWNAAMKVINVACVFCVPPMTAFVIFINYEFNKARLVSSVAFTTLSLFNILRFPLVVLPKALRAASGGRHVPSARDADAEERGLPCRVESPGELAGPPASRATSLAASAPDCAPVVPLRWKRRVHRATPRLAASPPRRAARCPPLPLTSHSLPLGVPNPSPRGPEPTQHPNRGTGLPAAPGGVPAGGHPGRLLGRRRRRAVGRLPDLPADCVQAAVRSGGGSSGGCFVRGCLKREIGGTRLCRRPRPSWPPGENPHSSVHRW
jgi:hypothetical protein